MSCAGGNGRDQLARASVPHLREQSLALRAESDNPAGRAERDVHGRSAAAEDPRGSHRGEVQS